MAVDGLDLKIDAGSFTVFVGPSGCGKTTSMRMINRMVVPTAGTVTVDGRDVATTDVVELRRSIGYVIQGGGLLPHRTVVDNVATVPVLRGQSRRAARRAALDVLDRVGLDRALANRYPAQLSGGQQQRVGVARALAADPPILLMDEPFSAVDPVVRAELQSEMQRLQAELRKTIVFVTHDIDEAVRLGDRVAVFGPHGGCNSTTPRPPYCRLPQPISSPISSAVTVAIAGSPSEARIRFRCTRSAASANPRCPPRLSLPATGRSSSPMPDTTGVDRCHRSGRRPGRSADRGCVGGGWVAVHDGHRSAAGAGRGDLVAVGDRCRGRRLRGGGRWHRCGRRRRPARRAATHRGSPPERPVTACAT